MRSFIFFATVLVASYGLAATRPAAAAESLNAAVDELAQTLVDSRAATDPTIRIAVNVFSHPDRRTSLLSNQIMVALTGRLVQLGAGKLRVIERAQLESALNELELANVPIFDAATAKDLGRFLGVDALVVGEMNALTDLVRIDTRMIAVDTVETMVSATSWIPLTPTVQKMVETNVTLSRPVIQSGDGPDPRNGIWKGRGTCGDASFGIAVAMVFNSNDTITAMQSYYPLSPNQGMEAGTLEMEGTFDPGSGKVKLSPGTWLYQPAGHSTASFEGVLDVAAGAFRGNYLEESCGEIMLRK